MCWRSSSSACSLPTPTGAVTRGIAVMIAETCREWSASNRMSRLVTMPSNVPSAPVTVSMAEETSGTPSRIRRLSRAVVLASAGSIAEWAGNSSTSSKVSA